MIVPAENSGSQYAVSDRGGVGSGLLCGEGFEASPRVKFRIHFCNSSGGRQFLQIFKGRA